MKIYVVSYYPDQGSGSQRFELCDNWQEFVATIPDAELHELWELESPVSVEDFTQELFGEVYGARVGEETASGIVVKSASKLIVN